MAAPHGRLLGTQIGDAALCLPHLFRPRWKRRRARAWKSSTSWSLFRSSSWSRSTPLSSRGSTNKSEFIELHKKHHPWCRKAGRARQQSALPQVLPRHPCTRLKVNFLNVLFLSASAILRKEGEPRAGAGTSARGTGHRPKEWAPSAESPASVQPGALSF